MAISDWRTHLKAIVAIWMTNGNKEVNGATEPCNFSNVEYYEGEDITGDLVREGLLSWASGESYLVIPTAEGIFEALS